MKTRVLAFGLPLMASLTFADGLRPPDLIPLPRKVESREGCFALSPGHGGTGESKRREAKILTDAGSAETGRYLQDRLARCTGRQFQVGQASAGQGKGDILLTVASEQGELGPEAYLLTVTPEHVTIHGGDRAGLFYGVQTLLQLLPARASEGEAAAAAPLQIPCVRIEDEPRFKWRGLMLDVSRHFFTKGEVKELLDGMVAYKLNTFHWHLTDDQGWRIQIKKYPRLTEVGAWRKSIGFGLDPKSGTAYGKDGRYGGYYTQEDIREVVEYARARHITIVPEIEMPGHASAALMAYPQYSCTGGPFTTDLPGGVFDGVYCAGNDDSFKFLEGVLSEVFELFPGKYVHIGGDEVLTNNWHNCVRCQARMKQEGLKKDIELESYFIRRMEKFINAHHRNLIGWSEIREGGLAQSAAVMDWVGGAVEAASAGHDVVMSPLADCYFDHYQSRNQSAEPHAIGGYLPLQQVYAFEPMPKDLPTQFEAHILGAQANVWTEYMPSFKHVQYMVFPRLCALAEVVWSPRDCRNWEDFSKRVEAHHARLEAMGINYRRGTPPQASGAK